MQQFDYKAGGVTAAARATPAEMAELRRWVARVRREQAGVPRRPAPIARAEVRRLLVDVPRAAREAVARHGRRVTERYGVSPQRQLAQIRAIGRRYALSPTAYYRFQLYLPDRWAQAGYYVEAAALVRHLHRTRDYPWRRVLGHKARFAAWCAERGFASVSTLATVDARVDAAPAPRLPAADLFTKPVSASKGQGARRWRYAGDGRYRSDVGELVDAEGLTDELTRQSAALGTGILIQPFVENHPDLQPLTPGGLATFRVVTCQMPGQPAMLLAAALRMPMGDSAVDNFDAGGLASLVDLHTARLEPAVRKRFHAIGDRWDAHPDTGAVIAGRPIARWDEVADVTRRAHDALGAPAPFIGWDVALGAQGPVLVEANPVPCTEGLQICTGVPLGATPYVPCFLAHLRTLPRR